jgi:hypothetical protein
MHLVALAGSAIGSAVCSGCANGDSTSYAGQQQKTPVKGGPATTSPEWVDWTKNQRSQKSPQSSEQPYPYGIGQP